MGAPASSKGSSIVPTVQCAKPLTSIAAEIALRSLTAFPFAPAPAGDSRTTLLLHSGEPKGSPVVTTVQDALPLTSIAAMTHPCN